MEHIKKFENYNDNDNNINGSEMSEVGLTREQLIKRLSFIHEDINKLHELLKLAGVDMDFQKDDAPILTFISNIDIASNVNDSEPEEQKWKNVK